jgi:acetylornithine deacetylase/succinyl-diaminopimelate desuccinylase-like protein
MGIAAIRARDPRAFIYACGSAVSKSGNLLAAIKAVEHLLAAGGLPMNVRFLLDRAEQSTGEALAQY